MNGQVRAPPANRGGEVGHGRTTEAEAGVGRPRSPGTKVMGRAKTTLELRVVVSHTTMMRGKGRRVMVMMADTLAVTEGTTRVWNRPNGREKTDMKRGECVADGTLWASRGKRI